MKIVVVESPAKAKTINKYLGDDYRVVASMGHIRDLPTKDGSVDPDDDFAMHWQVSDRSGKPINEIKTSLARAEKLILATDPDREGEAISWHIYHVMNEKNALKDISVERVVFHEITKSAILDAISHPRAINTELVNAYLARRALDYLVGFSLSPVLWKKLPGAKSAGRVQSVALKLVCEREGEIERFKNEEYWTVEAILGIGRGDKFTARLTHLDGEKLGKFTLNNQELAEAAVAKVKASSLVVQKIETKRTTRNPQPPFITSTLQQEASRKLGFSASRTMRVAQKLYEGISIGFETTGLITYMRTDSVQLSGEAIHNIRDEIIALKGNRYLPSTPRAYKSKAANAQEAHEAIRPTSAKRHPDAMRKYLDSDQLKLYELIWKRTVACQMVSAELDKTAVDIADKNGAVIMRASGSVIVFDGFLSLYKEGRDDTSESPSPDDDDSNTILPAMASGESLTTHDVDGTQHFTQPPPRFTDASLIKRMEELGIGRPSTYASTLQLLQDRSYMRKDQRRFWPEERGRIVSAFLESFFTQYVEYGFTARLEEDLDRVSNGKLEWKTLLVQFWKDFKATIEGTNELTRSTILETIDPILEAHFFPKDEKGIPIRKCTNCADGQLGLQLGKFGAFIGCSNYPECRYTRPVSNDDNDPHADALAGGDKHLGDDPESGLPVMLRKGPYGIYVQLGDLDVKKPKRVGLPKSADAASMTLQDALKLLALPREVGLHPDSNEMITAGLGRYGPFLKIGPRYVSIPDDDSVMDIGLNRAIVLIAEHAEKNAGKSLGDHPDGGEILVKKGRYGPYVEHDKIRATIPKSIDPETISSDEAIELISKKRARGPANHKAKSAKGSKSAKKTAKKPIRKIK